jgi:DNA repair exonuclease SbcCD ATPase subunit
MRELAQQMAEGLQASGGDDDVATEKVDELVAERNELRSKLADREERIKELEATVDDLETELQQRPEIGDRAAEAVEVLAEEFGVGDGDNEALRRKLKRARERIEELESRNTTADDLDADPLENRKVQSVVSDIESRLDDLGEKERQMFRYYLVSGPCSQKQAYKYAGGSPTSGAKSTKTKTLREAGLVKEVSRGEYDFGLREHLNDVLGDFSEEELNRVYERLESEVYDLVMEGSG